MYLKAHDAAVACLCRANTIARHDATYGDRSPALVVALGDKSASRKLEAAVIRRLRRGGVPLLSTDDGAHVAFGGAA